MKTKWKVLLVIGLSSVIIMVIGYRALVPTPRVISESPADFTLSAGELALVMVEPESASRYADKVVQTYGKVTAVKGNIITLGGNIVIHLVEPVGDLLQIGSTVAIKGRCIGYDDLLGEVKLDQASIVQTK